MINETMKQHVVEMYQKGSCAGDIAHKLNLTFGDVSLVLLNYYGVSRIKKSLRYNDPIVIQMVKDAKRKGSSLFEISVKFNLNTSVIQDMLCKNIQEVNKRIEERTEERTNPIQLNQKNIIKMYQHGVNLVQISQILTLKTKDVSNVLLSYYKVDRIKKSIRYNDPIVIQMVKEAYANGKYIREICKEFNLAENVVNYILEEELEPTKKQRKRSKVETMLSQLLEGKTLDVVGSSMGVSREYIRQEVTNLLGKENYETLFGFRKNWKNFLIQKKVKEMALEGRSLFDIILETGVDRDKIKNILSLELTSRELSKYLKRFNDVGLPGEVKKTEGTKQHPEIAEKIREGLSYAKVATLMKCSKGLVNTVAAMELTDEERKELNEKKRTRRVK